MFKALGNLGVNTKGYICLALVDVIWVASGYLMQVIYTKYNYSNSIAMAVYSVILGLILLLPLCWRKVSRASLPSVAQLGVLGFLWLLGQLTYLFALMYSSMSTCTAISGTATVFAYLFSMIILKYSFRWLSALGVAVCMAGIVLTALFNATATDPANSNESVIAETATGIIAGILAAVNSGLFTCLFKKWVKDDSNSGIVFGCFGFVGIVIGIPIIMISHYSGLQAFELPNWDASLLIVADAILCSVVCNFFFSKTFVYLSPVIVQVGLTMTIPVTFIITALILRTHRYPPVAIVGVVLIFLAVIVVSYDQAKYEQQSQPVKTEDVIECSSTC